MKTFIAMNGWKANECNIQIRTKFGKFTLYKTLSVLIL